MAGTGEPSPTDKTKAKLKTEGDNIYDFGGKLTKASRMSEQQFKNWCDQFENGYIDKTSEPNDTPYGMPRGNRPKIIIL